MNIAEVLRAQAETRPEAVALIETRHGRSRALTFAGLEAASGRVAHLLDRTGLRAGEAALIFHPMSIDLYVALLAVFRLGLTAMFADPSAGSEHIERCCALTPPRALIASPRAHLLRLFSPTLRHIPQKFSVGWPMVGAVSLGRAHALSPYGSPEPRPPDAPALLTFTSGSTGVPKAAVRTHGFLLAQHRVIERTLHLAAGEVDLVALPIFVLANLASGVTSLIPDADLRQPGAIDPAPVAAQIDAHRPTRAIASPAFLERLAAHCARHGRTFPSLRKIFTGGGPVSPGLLDRLQRVAPEAEITAIYGSTEAEPIAHVAEHAIGPEDRAAILAGSGLLAGPPVPGTHLRILPDRWGTPLGPYTQAEFEATCLAAKEVGEIVVSGDHVLRGYLGGRGDEETKFTVNGTTWHRTGDAGYVDDRGRLWLLGRCAARIEDRHGTLYPFAVECAVYPNPTIRRMAVVAQRGRRILAVEFYDGWTGADLDFVKERAAGARIDEVQVHRRIPVDSRHNAKIDYPALRKRLDTAAAGALWPFVEPPPFRIIPLTSDPHPGTGGTP